MMCYLMPTLIDHFAKEKLIDINDSIGRENLIKIKK